MKIYPSLLIKLLSLFGLMVAFAACGPTAANRDAQPNSRDHEHAHTIEAETDAAVEPAFDIVLTKVTRDGANLIFEQQMVDEAGSVIPQAYGEFANAEVFSYVWPTSLDSSTVGFEPEQGILALAVTSHPDFDDTPLVDENNDGDKFNDGRLWHSHWVVLVADERCGEAALKVKDIPEGETPAVPNTWPEVPLLIDSPSFPVDLTGNKIVATVPHAAIDFADEFSFDGVTAGLRINAQVHEPLLCVTIVHDIASGDLSLPGMAQP